MRCRQVVRILAACALGAGVVVGAATPAGAEPGAPAVPAGLAEALERDLGVAVGQVAPLLAAQSEAAGTESALRAALGDSFAGAWLDRGSTQLVVATTDPAEADAIRAAGATPSVVAVSEGALQGVLARLDARAAAAPDSVTGWYVDPASNSVVVSATDPSAARAFADGAGVDGARVEQVPEAARPLADLVGGDPIYGGNSRCSLGFNGTAGGVRYVITAGHCAELGGTWQGVNRQPIGPATLAAFPGDDYGLIRIDAPGWTQTPSVVGSGGARVTVTGSAEAPIGASVCRSGSTTGWRCGTVQAKNQTVNYGNGQVVSGLTRTSACAEPGDSGGPYVSGSQAQGVLSGGSGNCLIPLFVQTYFQPVNEILAARGLSLVTG